MGVGCLRRTSAARQQKREQKQQEQAPPRRGTKPGHAGAGHHKPQNRPAGNGQTVTHAQEGISPAQAPGRAAISRTLCKNGGLRWGKVSQGVAWRGLPLLKRRSPPRFSLFKAFSLIRHALRGARAPAPARTRQRRESTIIFSSLFSFPSGQSEMTHRGCTELPQRFSFFSASIGLSRFILRMAYIIVANTTANTLSTAIPSAAHGRRKA